MRADLVYVEYGAIGEEERGWQARIADDPRDELAEREALERAEAGFRRISLGRRPSETASAASSES